MNARRFYIEISFILVFSILLSYINTSHEVIDIVLEVLAIISIVSLFEIFPSSIVRSFLILIAALLIWMNYFPIHFLLPITYLATSLHLVYPLCILIMTSFIFPLSIIHYILLLLSSYICYQTLQSTNQLKNYYNLLDESNALRLDARTQREAILSSHQKDIDISILTERNRIARDLHDAVGHTLSRSILQIEALKLTIEDAKVIEQITQLQKSLQDGMTEIRQSIHKIHHESIHLESNIQQLAEEYPQLQIDFHNTLKNKVSSQFTNDLMNIIREAIINSIKHSDAYRIRIVLNEYPGFIKLFIKDNGSLKIDTISRPKAGMGHDMFQQIAYKYDAKLMIHYQEGYTIQMNFYKSKL